MAMGRLGAIALLAVGGMLLKKKLGSGAQADNTRNLPQTGRTDLLGRDRVTNRNEELPLVRRETA